MYLAYNTATVEKLGKPAVMMENRAFEHDARTGVTVRGVPKLRLLPASLHVDIGIDKVEEIRDGISDLLGDLVDALTRPLTPEEVSPEPMEAEKTSEIVFKGSLREVNQFFYKRGWSYGFPIIPPTKDAVEEMLEATDLPPDHVVAKIPPRMGKATVEKIAINAVMAGTLPSYMPLLIAAVKALRGPSMNVEGHLATVVGGGFFWVINGQIRHDLNFNTGVGLLSPDNIPGTAIAATMGLIGKNVGGARPGIEAMSSMGYPGKYSMCMAENEEDSPWEPLHVELGLNKEDNAITVFGSNMWQRLFPFGNDAEGIIRGICYGVCLGTGHGVAGGLIMPPADAKLLGEKGWTKKELASYLSEYARLPAYRHPASAQGVSSDFLGKQLYPVDPHFQVSLLNPERVRIVVAGREDATIHCYSGKVFGNCYGGAEVVKVDLPPNWDKLVKKYKDLVPTYIRY